MPSNEIISLDAKLYYSATLLDGGVNTAASVTWVEMDNVSDVNVSFSRETADGTTRGNGGIRKNVDTIADLEVTFTLDADTSVAWWAVIKNAIINRTVVPFAVMDGAETVAGADGYAANFKVTGFNRNEPIAGVLTYDVTVAVHEYFEWYTSV